MILQGEFKGPGHTVQTHRLIRAVYDVLLNWEISEVKDITKVTVYSLQATESHRGSARKIWISFTLTLAWNGVHA